MENAFDGSACNCETTPLIASIVAPVAPSCPRMYSSAGVNSTETCRSGSVPVVVVTVGSRFVIASSTPSGFVKSALKTWVMSDASALLAMLSRLAVVSVKRVVHASTSWSGRTCTSGDGATSGVTAIMLTPTRAIPAVT